MTGIPDDLQALLDPSKDRTPYHGPLEWLWVFDPMTAKVTVTHNEDRPPAHHVTHKDLAPEVNHPQRLQGYAYKIKGGFRISDDSGRPVEDPYITEKIRKALRDDERRHT